MPVAEIGYLASEVQSLRAAVTQNDANQLKLGEQLEANAAAIVRIGKDVADVKTLLQLGRALGTFAAGVRWIVVWITPIVILAGGFYAFFKK